MISFLFDLDELAELDRRFRLFGHNRWAVFSFWDRDHGGRDGADLRRYVEHVLASVDIHLPGGRTELLCYPRLFGYAFNPLSVYYCYDAAERIRTVIYEVRNTFGEYHSYVIPVSGDGRRLKQSCAKKFYVSPFMAVAGQYEFDLTRPGEDLKVAVNLSDGKGRLLNACFTGQARRLSGRNLRSIAIRFPLLTVKVIAGIHWEALKLWLKGMPLFDKPDAPADRISYPGQEDKVMEKVA